MAQGEGEREEIGIFLIKMQFYKFFYLMLQELNIIFLLLDLRGLPPDWLAEAKAGTGKENIFIFRLKNLREETKIRKCKPRNCIPISNSPPPKQKVRNHLCLGIRSI